MSSSAPTAAHGEGNKGIKALLPAALGPVIDGPESGPFKDEAEFLYTLEALTTLQVIAYKWSLECQQRVLSYASRDFGDTEASGVQRAMSSLPLVRWWVEKLRKRLDSRSKLPLPETGLMPRLLRVCSVFEVTPQESQLIGALLMMRATHAFSTVKLGMSIGGYGGLGGVSGSGSKPGVTLSTIMGVDLCDVAAFQKPERKHVKQGVVIPGVQLLTEIPALQLEAVLLMLNLPLTESQVFNIEKSDLMKVLREEPGFDESKLGPKKRQREDAKTPQQASAEQPGMGGASSLYSLLQMEVAAEATLPSASNGAPASSSTQGRMDGLGAKEEGGAGLPAVPNAASAAAPTARETRGAKRQKPPMPEGQGGGAEEAAKAGGGGTAAVAGQGAAGGKAKLAGGGEDDAKAANGAEDEEGEAPKPRNGPYESDLEYLQDMFQLVKLRGEIARVRRHMEERGQQMANTRSGNGDGDGDDASDDEISPMHAGFDDGYWGMDEYTYEVEAFSRGRFGRNMRHEHSKQARHEGKRARKLQARADRLAERIQSRLDQMSDASMRLPRLERLSTALGLGLFEKNVVVSMIGQAIAPRSIGLMGGGGGGGGGGGVSPSKTMQVEVLLRAFSHSLQQQIEHRKHFYKSAVLVREGILVLHGDELGADLTQTLAEIDRRMLDFVVGLDTEFSELMDGSHLYSPTVAIEEVVLAEEKKTLVLETVKNFETFQQASRQLELSKKLAYGRGLVLLFYGPSGTGKTMLANALANVIGKKVLMINFPALGANSAGSILKLVFREAKIHDAILFFDECESIFMDRTKGNLQVNTVLTELERHEGLCILATNRPMDLDEAMHRRITLAIEFTKPDLLLREKIWRSMAPPKLPLAADVDFMLLARKYELQGGFIKNAWLSALSMAVSRDGVSPTLTMDDLHAGASHQLRGRLAMSNFDRGIVPQHGLESVILPSDIKEKLKQIVNYSKAQAVLFGQWGFQQQHGRAQGISALFHGLPGTGKTMAAEAIGFDVGRPLMIVNCAQLMDKYVGESAKNIEKVFVEAKGQDAVLVFDEAEGLLASRSSDGGSTSRHDNLNVGILLHHMEEFSGIVVAITNRYEQVDTAFHRRFKFIMEFPVPESAVRAKLWRSLIPPAAPLDKKVDFEELGARFELTGGHIKSAVFRAAVEASLQAEGETRMITMERLVQAAQEEVDKDGDGKRPAGMYT
jgi:SpoVK/Ycf46/Vps4 family AAA+-type ATPase